jgi:hypothetical protein
VYWQSKSAARFSFLDYIATLKTKTGQKIRDFFETGLSVDTLLQLTGLEPARPLGH